MRTARLADIVSHCDGLLNITTFDDWDGAVNGLQVENRGTVTRIAVAVDASLATVKLAIAARADLLIVHHGLFWKPSHPWTGARYELLTLLLENNLAVYSSHLPLDAHPRLGNNAQLCRALALSKLKPFFFEKGRFIGYKSETRLKRQELTGRLHHALKALPKVRGMNDIYAPAFTTNLNRAFTGEITATEAARLIDEKATPLIKK